jgi:hypothetical protein
MAYKKKIADKVLSSWGWDEEYEGRNEKKQYFIVGVREPSTYQDCYKSMIEIDNNKEIHISKEMLEKHGFKVIIN